MTTIIIRDVESTQDLLSAISAVTAAFTDPSLFDSEERVFARSAPEDCSCDDCMAPSAQSSAHGARPPVAAYLPCPRRGTHLRLTDCWMCWCDVHRGAAVETDVLSEEAWDLSLTSLLTSESEGADGDPTVEGLTVERRIPFDVVDQPLWDAPQEGARLPHDPHSNGGEGARR